MRQSIINGMTRKEYFLSKLLSILAISIVASAFYFIVCALIGFTHTPNPSFAKLMDNDFATARFFLSCMGYLSMAMFLAFWVRRSGIALFLYLSYVIMLEPGLRWLIYWKVWKSKATLFFPANTLEDVMPNPLMRFAEMAPDELEMDWLLEYSTACFFSTFFTIGFIALSYYLFNKRDI